jgi:hypothetical protein
VTVRVELENEPDDAARAQIIRAVAHAQPDAKGRIDGAVLSVTSHAIQTEVAGKPDSVHRHRWVRGLIARALLPIAAAQPVRRITIE